MGNYQVVIHPTCAMLGMHACWDTVWAVAHLPAVAVRDQSQDAEAGW